MVAKSRRTAARRAKNQKKKAVSSAELTKLATKKISATTRAKNRKLKMIDECFTKACNSYVNQSCRNAVKDLDIHLKEAAKKGKEHFPLYTTWSESESYSDQFGGGNRNTGSSDSNVINAIEWSLKKSLDRENVSYDNFDLSDSLRSISVWSLEDRIETRLKNNLKRRGLAYANVSSDALTYGGHRSLTAFSVVWGKLEKKANKSSDGWVDLHG